MAQAGANLTSAPGSSSSSTSSAASLSNRLSESRSPYLLQHAQDPVHWQQWGDEAFELAGSLNRLVFLSIGYSTCHWCHVMHRESFQNPRVAQLLNEQFISIKVDREERPDVDRVYMNFVLALGVGGGWPLSVWLTPARQPVYGGTYYPPEERYFGRPGFRSLLNSLADAWRDKREEVEQSGDSIVRTLKKNSLANVAAAAAAAGAAGVPQAESVAQECMRQLSKRFDAEKGGFGKAPKFPQPSQLRFLLTFASLQSDTNSEPRKQALHMCSKTLHSMAKGGIHDHVNCGFHRYSVDGDWHVPHFEKMLYDQAQLLHTYALASSLCCDTELASVAHDIVRYVEAELSHKATGAFYSAQDADSLPDAAAKANCEGAFCVWTLAELTEILGSLPAATGSDTTLLQVISEVFNCKEAGNVDPYQDPHDELRGKNVLIRRKDWPELASKLQLTEPQLRAAVEAGLQRLHPVRAARPKPHLDSKIITAWNAMMLGALAVAGRVLNRDDYLARATACADFLHQHLWNEETQTLHRVCYIDSSTNQPTLGSTPILGFLDDHAQLIRSLLLLYSATLQQRHLAWAQQLQLAQDAAFWDAGVGAYYDCRDSPELPIRPMEEQDGAEPCGNSVSAGNLVAMRNLLHGNAPAAAEAAPSAEKIFNKFSLQLHRIPLALPEMASACQLAAKPPLTIVLAAADAASAEPLLDAAWSPVAITLPHRQLLMADHADWSRGYQRDEAAAAAAFVCKDFACQLPVTDAGSLVELLRNA